jgi:hypothetical protein
MNCKAKAYILVFKDFWRYCKMVNIIKERTHDFMVGEMSYNDFYKFLIDNYNDICCFFQNEINNLQENKLDLFFHNFSQPIMGEINFYHENFNRSIEELKKMYAKYGKTLPETLLKNTDLENLRKDNRNLISSNYQQIETLIKFSLNESGRGNVYGGNVSFFTQRCIFDLFARLYDSLFEKIENKNYEYFVRTGLIIDTALDKIVGGNNKSIETIMEEKIFKPTEYITKGKNPDLTLYNKRLKEVNKLVNKIFPSEIGYDKIGFDIHGKWPLEDTQGATLEEIDHAKNQYQFRSNKKSEYMIKIFGEI